MTRGTERDSVIYVVRSRKKIDQYLNYCDRLYAGEMS
jgi:hypothetical protein